MFKTHCLTLGGLMVADTAAIWDGAMAIFLSSLAIAALGGGLRILFQQNKILDRMDKIDHRLDAIEASTHSGNT